MIPVGPILAGAGVVSNLIGGLKRRPSNRRAIAELRASRPTGYLTPEDLVAAERTRGRLTQGAQAQGRLGQYDINRRFQARGLAGSPSEERSLARNEQQTALGAENAGNTAEEQLYNMRTGREAFQHQNDLAIFGAETGAAQREQERQQAQQGAFWNSLNEFIPTIMSGLGPKGSGTDYSGYKFNATSGRYEPPQYGPNPAAPSFNPGTQPPMFPGTRPL